MDGKDVDSLFSKIVNNQSPEDLQEMYEQIGYVHEFNDGHCSFEGYEVDIE